MSATIARIPLSYYCCLFVAVCSRGRVWLNHAGQTSSNGFYTRRIHRRTRKTYTLIFWHVNSAEQLYPLTILVLGWPHTVLFFRPALKEDQHCREQRDSESAALAPKRRCQGPVWDRFINGGCHPSCKASCNRCQTTNQQKCGRKWSADQHGAGSKPKDS